MNGLLSPCQYPCTHCTPGSVNPVTRAIRINYSRLLFSRASIYLPTMPGKHTNRTSYRDPARPRGQRLTHTERVEMLTLYNRAGWTKRRIARELKLAQSSVRLVIQS